MSEGEPLPHCPPMVEGDRISPRLGPSRYTAACFSNEDMLARAVVAAIFAREPFPYRTMIFRVVALFLMSIPPALADGITPAAAVPAKPRVFAVSQVEKAKEALKTRPANELLRLTEGDVFEAAPDFPDQQWVVFETKIRHPFLAAAHLAFADHRPLALSPDMIWLLLNQMASAEVLANPESYRHLFAPHSQGKRTLTVIRNDFIAGNPANDWPGVFAEFEATIVKHAPDPLAGGFAHAFSTSTPCEIAARRVTLLKATSGYYQFYLSTMCGIPEIALHGNGDDWRWIREHAEDFRKLGMRRRIDALIPVLDQFVAAADGTPDAAFWRSFYKFSSESGSSYVSGWINLFFLDENDKALEQVLAQDFRWAGAPLKETTYGALNLPLAKRSVTYLSNGVMTQEFVWSYFAETRPMLLRAGFMGISQDPRTLTLKPQLAWQVLQRKTSEEERLALGWLGSIRQLGYFEIMALDHDFLFDQKTGRISVSKDSRSDTIDTEFWLKALPLMNHLEQIDLKRLLPRPDDSNGTQPEVAICKALLSLPGLTAILVPRELDAKCLELLRERKDWTITVNEK